MNRVAALALAALSTVPASSSAAEWSETAAGSRELRGKGDYEGALALLGDPTPADEPARVAERELLTRVLSFAPDDRASFATADSAGSVVDAHFARGRYRSAEEPAQLRWDIYDRLLPSDHPDRARALSELSVVRILGGDAEAEAGMHESARLLRARYGEASEELAMLYATLGGVRKARGELAEAERWVREAVEIESKIPGRSPDRWSYAMTLLARVFDLRGDLARAERLDREQLRRAVEASGPDDVAIARSSNNLGTTLHHLGEYAAARDHFARALAIRRRLLEANHPDIATALNNLAAAVESLGDLEEAGRLKRESLAIRRASLPAGHRRIAATQASLALNLRRQGRLEESETLFREALADLEAALGADHPEVARAVYNLASVLQDRDRVAESDSTYRRALEVFRARYGDSHRHVATCLRWLASSRVDRQEYAAAESLLVEASQVHERARRRIASAEHGELFAESPDGDLAMVLAARGRDVDAFRAAERAHGRLLEALLVAAPERWMSAELIARRDSLRAALADAEDRRIALRRDEASADALASADRELVALEAGWAEVGREIGPLPRGEPFAIERIQRALDSETALCGWLGRGLPGDRGWSWAWVLRETGDPTWIRVPWLAAGESDGEKRTAAEGLRRALGTAASWTLRVPDSGPQRDDRHELWTARVEPLLPALAGVRRLVIVPAQEMLGLPVECFLAPDGTTAADRWQISYVPSATLFAWLAEREKSGAAGALLVGDPIGPGPGLPLSAEELADVRATLEGGELLAGGAATESRLTRLARDRGLDEFRVMHFATHANVDVDRPDRSALLLSSEADGADFAGALGSGRYFDGKLTAGEIVREWELDASLVTLSGCRTGLGRATPGEGYLGLAHAFLQAGARTVVMTLWDVDDRASARFMRRFYAHLGGETGVGVAEALAAAKRELRDFRDERGGAPFAHPVYWAGFVALGDPSSKLAGGR